MEFREFIEQDRDSVIELRQTCNLTRAWNDPHKNIDRQLEFQPTLFFVRLDDTTLMAAAMADYDGHRG